MSQNLKHYPLSASVMTAELVADMPESMNLAHIGVDSLGDAMALLEQAERVIASQRQRIAQLESMALTDELTGLVNRRGLMAALRRELAAAERTEEEAQGVLVLCDLNGFKQINDTHGHNAGDAYLVAVARALQAEVRSCDIVARIGGDEFAIMLTRMDGAMGLPRLEKLEDNFHTHALNWGGRVLPLSASFGAAVYGKNDTPESLLAAADLRLYAQKARRH